MGYAKWVERFRQGGIEDCTICVQTQKGKELVIYMWECFFVGGGMYRTSSRLTGDSLQIDVSGSLYIELVSRVFFTAPISLSAIFSRGSVIPLLIENHL